MKLNVVEQLGETAVILPELVNRGLAANDRLKYYLTLLQAVVAQAARPQQPAATLRAEREASGVPQVEFDELVGRSRRQADGLVSAAGIGQLRTLLLADLETMILLAIVGALIIIVVAESLARAFAIVGAAGLVRYRARIDDPKDAGVMLVALAVGLTAGSGQLMFATLACLFVIAVLWVLELFEPEARSRFDLRISGKTIERLRPEIEHSLNQKGVSYELRGSAPGELRYEVTVPYQLKLKKLSKLIRSLDGAGSNGHHAATAVQWEIKKYKTVHA